MSGVDWRTVGFVSAGAAVLVGSLVVTVAVRSGSTTTTDPVGLAAASGSPRSTPTAPPSAAPGADAGGWCTTAEIERADVHHRGPIGDRMPAVMGFMNLSTGLEVQHEAVGWRVVREEGDLCAVVFIFRAGAQTKQAQFGLFRRPAMHLVPANPEAGDVTDMFDLWVLGVQLQGQRPRRGDHRLELASELRGRREQFPGVNDFYVDHPDSTSLVMESESCGSEPTPMPRNSASTEMVRAGFVRVVCRDRLRQVPHELPGTSRRPHR